MKKKRPERPEGLPGGTPSKITAIIVAGVVLLGAAAIFLFSGDGSGIVSAQEDGGKYPRKTKVARETEPARAADAAAAPVAAEKPALADGDVIYLNAGRIDVTSDAARALQAPLAEFPGRQMRLVKFGGPIERDWYELLAKTGVAIVDYVPNYAYLVYGDYKSFVRLAEAAEKPSSPIVWEAAYTDAQRIDPRAVAAAERNALTGAPGYYTIQLFADEQANAETLGLIASLQKAEPKARASYLHYVNVTTALGLDDVRAIAARPDVVSIQSYAEPVKLDERQSLIVSGNLSGSLPAAGNYLSWLAAKGFTPAQFASSNFVVDVTDSGLDNGTTAPNHFALYAGGSVTAASRVAYTRLEGTANAGSTIQGCDGHGTLNGHIIGGFVPDGAPFNAFPHADASGYRYDLGVAPFVRIGSSVVFDPGTFTNPNYENLQSRAYGDGARISSNSWGASGSSYTADAQRYDALVRDAQPAGAAVPAAGNQQMVIVFAAGNDGSGAGTVGSPGTAKNVITVGASEGVQAFGAADQCGVADSGADNLNDIINFSSRGPTADGRKKPDLVAPGTHITGGVAQSPGQLSTTPAAPNGSANTCFIADGVCAGPGTSNFFPLSQQWYTASSGTSHSTPAVAGGAALVRQHFINLGLAPPSPAMTKAVLMNGARYLRGVSANDNLYSNNQGMGLLDLNKTLDGAAAAAVLRDQTAADKFTATGQTRVFGAAATPGKLMRVTLAWTDAPGATTGSSVKNNLNLTVANGANTYLGNVFTGQLSTTGGAADAVNNVESVYLPASATGAVTITVTAANINSDGVPNDADPLDQDFALIVTEADGSALANVVAAGQTLAAESFVPANNAPDPGETVTVDLALQNTGLGNPANLTATLLATGGVLNPGAAQSYGALAAGGAAVARPFTFVANGPCGGTITLTLQLQDGASNLGTVTYTMSLGTVTAVTAENFDGAAAPALPAGWTTARTGTTPPALFATRTTTPDTAPNAAFTNGSSTSATNSLISPAIALPAGQPGFRLSFRQTLNFEGSTTCYDGGILEISTDGGTTFRSVTNPAVGGSFSAGGYNGTISSGNPLGAQAGWCSTQSSYFTTTLNLPGTLSGQTVKFRWRAGWDSIIANSGANWVIDSISLASSQAICAGTPTTVSVSASVARIRAGQPVTFTATVTPAPSGGTVDFLIDGNVVTLAGGGSNAPSGVPIDGAGQASYTTTALATGTHTVVARYAGTSSYGFSTTSLAGGFSVLPPTAASVAVAGRVLTADGRGVANAVVTLTSGGAARAGRTNSFGYFRIDGLSAGETYLLQAAAKNRRFAPQVVVVNDEVADLLVVAE